MSWDCLAARGVVDGDFVVSSSGCVSLIQSAYALFLLAGQSLLGIGILSSEQGTTAETFLAPAPLKWIRDCSSSRGRLYPLSPLMMMMCNGWMEDDEEILYIEIQWL